MEISINQLCNGHEEPIGYYCHQRIEPIIFIAAIRKWNEEIGCGDDDLNLSPEQVKHTRWKYEPANRGGDEDDLKIVPASDDDLEGFEATYIQCDC
jgi:hypothetical protein